MNKLNAFYFSGTGNTKYVVNYLADKLSCIYDVKTYDITENHDFKKIIAQSDLVLIGFPIYASSPPIPIRNFVVENADSFKDKVIAIAETQYFFSGDGGASIGRTLEKFGANVRYVEHFNMPNNLADSSVFKVKNDASIQRIVERAKRRMDVFTSDIITEKQKRRGFNPVSHAVGYLCQRKWWRKNEKAKRSSVKIDNNKCSKCGLCIKSCPAHNLMNSSGIIQGQGKCVFCYRCINLCPRSAITILGTQVVTAYKGIKE